MPNDSTIIFRIESELKEAFDQIAQASERTTSQYLRAFIKDTVRKHQQAYAIAPESINTAKAVPNTNEGAKIEPRPKKGQKLNRMPTKGKAK